MISKRLFWILFVQGCVALSAMAQTSNAPLAPPPESAWSSDLIAALKQAEAEKKMIIVDVTPDWNVSGKRLDKETFTDSKVQDQLKQAVLVKINPEASDDASTMAKRLKVQTYPAIVILNYKGNILAQETGFQTPVAFQTFLAPFIDLFKSDPLGAAQPDPIADDAMNKALQQKPTPDQLSPTTLYYCLLNQCEITVQKDGSSHMISRRALYMANPDAARDADDVSGIAVRYDASREKVNFIYVRLIDLEKQAFGLDFADFHDKPAVTSGDVSWDEHRLVAPSQRAQKGQIFDYEIVRDTKPQIPGHFEYRWPINSDHLLEVSQKLIIHFPPDVPMNKAAVDCDQPVVETKAADGTITWEIDSSSVPKTADTLFISNSAEGFRGYRFYTPITWDAIASWYQGQLADHDKLPPEAIDLVNQTKQQNVNPRDQALALYRWVVDNIRLYVVDFQESPLQPHAVDTTFHYHSGDIKDQSLLLIALLHQAGIPAYPVLLKKGYGSQFDQNIPMIHQFDHCIVAAKIDDKDVYFDPSATETTTPGWLPVSDSKAQALKVVDGKAELVTLPDYQARHLDPTISEDSVLLSDGSAISTARYSFEGAAAVRMKSIFGKLSLEKARQAFALIFSNKGGMTLIDFSMTSPDQKGDTFQITCVADVLRFAVAGPGGLSFMLGTKPEGENWSTVLSRPRSEPYRFYPDDPSTNTYSVTLPPGMKLISRPNDFKLETPFMSATQITTLAGDKLEMVEYSVPKDAVIPLDRVDEIKNAFEQMEDHHTAIYVVGFDPNAPPSPAQVAPAPMANPSQPADEPIVQPSRTPPSKPSSVD